MSASRCCRREPDCGEAVEEPAACVLELANVGGGAGVLRIRIEQIGEAEAGSADAEQMAVEFEDALFGQVQHLPLVDRAGVAGCGGRIDHTAGPPPGR